MNEEYHQKKKKKKKEKSRIWGENNEKYLCKFSKRIQNTDQQKEHILKYDYICTEYGTKDLAIFSGGVTTSVLFVYKTELGI